MSGKKRGLGRGLGALIPQGESESSAMTPPSERPDDAPDVEVPPASPSAPTKTASATSRSEGSPKPRSERVSRETRTSVPAIDLKRRSSGDGPDQVTEQILNSPTPSNTPSSPDLVPVPGARFAEIDVTAIVPNAKQPRTVFDEDELTELSASIAEVGVLQPVVVRETKTGYELIMGERRWRATQAAGLSVIPAIIRETGDEDLLRDALLENLHRSQLNPLEEAAAYQQLLDDFKITHEELAKRIARSRPQITNTLRLLRLPPLVQRRLAAGVLSAGHARALLGLSDGAAMERLAQRIVAEGLSVRATEETVALGGDAEPTAKRKAPRAGQRNEALEDLAARLSDRLDTRVKVALGRSKGRLTVEFASVQDLNRILTAIAPDDPGVLK